MLFKWLDASEAAQVGASLADDFYLQTSGRSGARRKEGQHELQKFLQRFRQQVERAAQPLKLNVFKRAKLANSFKWRLLEKGVDREIVDDLTNALVMQLSAKPGSSVSGATPAGPPGRQSAQTLLAQGNDCFARGAYDDAVACYEELLNRFPREASAHNNLGAVLCKLGRYKEAEAEFRRAIGIRASYPDAQCNLGTLLAWMGRTVESEAPLRRALKLKPAYIEAQVSLGATLTRLGRLAEARTSLEKALRIAPRNVDALVELGQIAGPEGKLAEAEELFRRALEIEPKASGAWAGLVRLRKMTASDSAWLKGAEEAAAGSLTPIDQANIQYAIGKYRDDVGDYARAFQNYQRANELQKLVAAPYNREARTGFVDDMIRIYGPEAIAQTHAGASESNRPVFVVGMMRSGTSLVEQIISSHPAGGGAGELDFWSDAVRKHAGSIRTGMLDESLSRKLADAYLDILEKHSPDASRVVDKATFNSDYLGIIHSVFPNARMIYLQRDPIDTCLSCYFQQFSPALNFTMDLADLAHYYREHERLVRHWRSVLPASTLLVVPYAELIADQERWIRQIIEFLGLEWDARCLEFHKTDRTVLTASFWQVRQKVYQSSVGRWHHYEKFIGPLKTLADLSG